MFKFYDIERKSVIRRASFILHLRKNKLKPNSLHVDLNMSFFFICVFLNDRWTRVFYAIVSYTLFTCPFYMWPSKKYFLYLLITINF